PGAELSSYKRQGRHTQAPPAATALPSRSLIPQVTAERGVVAPRQACPKLGRRIAKGDCGLSVGGRPVDHWPFGLPCSSSSLPRWHMNNGQWRRRVGRDDHDRSRWHSNEGGPTAWRERRARAGPTTPPTPPPP